MPWHFVGIMITFFELESPARDLVAIGPFRAFFHNDHSLKWKILCLSIAVVAFLYHYIVMRGG